MPNIVLGVSGSVAAYRAADLAREMMRQGWTVRVCLTDAASKFVSPALFEALTGQPCLTDVFEEPVPGRMAHIDWARSAEVLVIAPATANTISKIVHGVADDMLSTIAVAYTGPIVVAPAMNPAMYLHEATREALKVLAARAAVIVEPAEGDVACGESGQGKLASIPRIVESVRPLVLRRALLAGKKVLITSGPTQEPLDDVRFLSNRSSGKMGFALARAALLMGASVHVVSGPTSEAAPYGATVDFVQTADEMLKAALLAASDADLIIGAAAVADYRPAGPQKGKMRRSGEDLTVRFVPNPDVIATLSKSSSAKVVGFAAEPDSDDSVALAKIKSKALFAIAANDISQPGIGFDADENELKLLFADGTRFASERMSKLGCALWMLEHLAGAILPAEKLVRQDGKQD